MEYPKDPKQKESSSKYPLIDSSLSWRSFWPEVNTADSALTAIRLGIYSCILLTYIYAGRILIGLLSGARIDPLGYLDPVLFALLAFGLYRKSRTAAVLGILIFLASVIYSWVNVGLTCISMAIEILLAIGLLNGIRGTYAINRLDQPLKTRSPNIFTSKKPIFVIIRVIIELLFLPPTILSVLILLSNWIGISTADPFIYIVIFISLLPGMVLTILLNVRAILKVLLLIIYVPLGFLLLAFYSIIFFCVALGECL